MQCNPSQKARVDLSHKIRILSPGFSEEVWNLLEFNSQNDQGNEESHEKKAFQ